MISALLALDRLIAAVGPAARLDEARRLAGAGPHGGRRAPLLRGRCCRLRRRLRVDAAGARRRSARADDGRRSPLDDDRPGHHRLPDLAALRPRRTPALALPVRAAVQRPRPRPPLRRARPSSAGAGPPVAGGDPGDGPRRAPSASSPSTSAAPPDPAEPRLGHAPGLPPRVPMSGPYTPGRMDAARSSDDIRTVRDARIDGLRAEASEAVGYSANTLRTVSQRYRTAYAEEFARWQALRDELDAIERGRPRVRTATGPTATIAARTTRRPSAAEAGAEDARSAPCGPTSMRVGRELGRQQTELAKLEIALRNLESTWLFLERGDASLVGDGEGLPSRRPDADRRGPGVGALAARPGGPRRAGPGPLERDLPGRVHRAGHRHGPAGGPDGAALPARPAPARARLRSGRSSASSGRRSSTSSASTARSPTRSSRPTAPDRARDQRRSWAPPPDRLTRHPADGRPARPAGSTAECAQARRGLGRHGRERDRRWRLGPDRPRRRPRVRCRSRGRPRPTQLRTAIHA